MITNDPWTSTYASLAENQQYMRTLLSLLEPCSCTAKRTWWGGRRPLEHTERCRAAENCRIEVELALVEIQKTMESINALHHGNPHEQAVDVGIIRAVAQVDEALTAGYRWRATR